MNHSFNPNVRPLEGDEIDAGIGIFAQAIARKWPNTADEARQWVTGEFHHPESVVLGHFNGRQLNGVICLTPFTYVFSNLDSREQELVGSALKILVPGRTYDRMAHLGGLGVASQYTGLGLGGLLFTAAEELAVGQGYELVLGHTARKLRVGDLYAGPRGWQALKLTEKIHYSNPSDLEKLWGYKLCNP